jgi:hypothetical protein
MAAATTAAIAMALSTKSVVAEAISLMYIAFAKKAL